MSFPFSNPNSPQTRIQSPPIVAQIDPPATGPQALQYPIGTFWINTASDIVFTLTSFANGEANWVSQISGGGTFTSLDVTPGPTAIEGEFRVDGNVDEAEVIRIRENGGTSGTIEIASLQGTGSDSIKLQSVEGGIEITTDAASGDIAVTSNLGRVTIGSGEDIAGAVEIGVEGGTTSSFVISVEDGTATDSIKINSEDGGIQLLAEAAGKDISIDSDLGSIALVSGENVARAIDLLADGGTTATITARNTVGTAAATTASSASIALVSTAGGVGIVAGKDYHFTATETSLLQVTGVSKDLTLQSVGGSVNALASEAAVNAIRILASDAAGGIDIDAGTGGVTLDTTAAFSIDGATASNVTVTGAAADLTLSSSGGSVNVLASEAVANAVRILASDAAGGIDIDAGTGGIDILTTGVLSIDSAATSNLTVTGAFPLTVNSTLGQLALSSGQAAANAVRINASDAAGGIDIDAGTGAITVDTTGVLSLDSAAASNLTVTGAFDLTVNSTLGSVIINGGEAVLDAIQLTTAAGGGIDVNAGTAGMTIDSTGLLSIDSAGATNLTTTGAFDLTVASSAGSVIVNGGEAVVDAIQLTTTNAAGGIDVNAGTGGVTIDTTGLLSLDSAGATNLTATGAFDVTIQSTAGSVVVGGGEAVVNAIELTNTNAAGGIDINAGTGGITIDSTGLMSLDAAGAANFTTTGAFDLTVNSTAGSIIINGGEAVADAVQILAGNAAGGVTINSGASGAGGVTIGGGVLGNVSITNVQVAGTAGPSPTVATTNNARVGSVTYAGYTQAAAATLVVTLTNSYISATSAILASASNVGANDAQMNVSRIKPAAGSAEITIVNNGAAALNGNMVLTFWVLS